MLIRPYRHTHGDQQVVVGRDGVVTSRWVVGRGWVVDGWGEDGEVVKQDQKPHHRAGKEEPIIKHS